MPGKLYLIPTILSEEALHVIPAYVHEITKSISCFFVENERTARRYLRKSGFTRSFDEIKIFPLSGDSSMAEISNYADMLGSEDCGLMSEAGVPAVADPGHLLVRMAHEKNIRVVPLVGPSSILMALMASGLNGQQFVFHGYLPQKQNDRIRKIKQIEARCISGETQIFIETPYRNNSLIRDLLDHCHGGTLLCIASDITGDKESIRTRTISDWKKNTPAMEKIPAIYLIGNFV